MRDVETSLISLLVGGFIVEKCRDRESEESLRLVGRRIGSKIPLLLSGTSREVTIEGVATFLQKTLWPFLFGKKMEDKGMSKKVKNRLILRVINSIFRGEVNGNLLICGIFERILEGWCFRVSVNSYIKEGVSYFIIDFSNQ